MLQVSQELFGDRRSNSRVLTSLPVSVQGQQGITRDLSTKGVFFEIDESPLPDSEFDLSVDLLQVDARGVVRMVCKVRIVRVERREGKLGIAATIQSQSLVTVAPAAPENGCQKL